MKVLVFDFKKFINHKLPDGKKPKLSAELVKAMQKLDGMRIRKYNKRSFSRNVFGETHYILVGDEKISVGKEFGRWIETQA